MATATQTQPSFRRAMVLMTATSFLVPAGGVITAPVLARALGADGRGELAAALAPAGLMLAVATLGLPDALTYFLAKHPAITRPALAWASTLTIALGFACAGITWWALPFLSDDDQALGRLILLATVLTVPALLVGVLRGAAMGRQMYGAVAVERLVNTVLRIVLFTALWLTGDLDVLVAVLVSSLLPIIAGLTYGRLLTRPAHDPDEPVLTGGPVRPFLSFGSKVWLGSVASMLLARVGQLFMAPLSSVEDLGLYVVASTVSDMPLIVALAIQGTLFGVNSKSTDARQLTHTSRVTVLLGFVGCAVLGLSVPLWVPPLFGAEFTAAVVPTQMLVFSALLCIPGLLAAAGIAAWGRPGVRSAGLGITLVANVIAFVLLVPALGVYGACWTSILSNVVMTTYMVVRAARIMQVPVHSFLAPRRADVAWLVAELRAVGQRLFRHRDRSHT